MHGETVQVQHVAADPVNTEERRKMTKRLKRNDRIHLGGQRFVFREQLRQSGDRQSTGQHVDGEASAEPSLDGGEQAKQREKIPSEIEKIRPDTNR